MLQKQFIIKVQGDSVLDMMDKVDRLSIKFIDAFKNKYNVEPTISYIDVEDSILVVVDVFSEELNDFYISQEAVPCLDDLKYLLVSSKSKVIAVHDKVSYLSKFTELNITIADLDVCLTMTKLGFGRSVTFTRVVSSLSSCLGISYDATYKLLGLLARQLSKVKEID